MYHADKYPPIAVHQEIMLDLMNDSRPNERLATKWIYSINDPAAVEVRFRDKEEVSWMLARSLLVQATSRRQPGQTGKGDIRFHTTIDNRPDDEQELLIELNNDGLTALLTIPRPAILRFVRRSLAMLSEEQASERVQSELHTILGPIYGPHSGAWDVA